MSTLGEKIGRLLDNNEMTQAQLAEIMCVSASTVQKWVRDRNTPDTASVVELCKLFYVPLEKMLDEEYDIPEYIRIDSYLPDEELFWPEERRDSVHEIFDADLAREGRLHRFTNAGGALCSAIYVGHRQVWWHYRKYEARMLRDWNKEYGNDR